VKIDPQAAPVAPYNLIATREWLLLVARTRDRFESISLNSLAFAGALLAKSEEQLSLLKQHGPMAAIQGVTLAE
jgi:ATP adenylyltransferase